MKIPYVLSLLILCLGCGDIIKAKDPRPGRKPYQPTTLTDQTGSCPYYPGIWSGRCTGQGHDPSRIIPLDLAQSGCTLFALNSVSVYSLTESKDYKQGDKAVRSRAQWLNEERSQLELTEEWTESERTLQRTMTIDVKKGEAVEKLLQKASDGSSTDVHACSYQRS
jgi:hypothetical protein